MEQRICFSVLALKPKYRSLAKNLASDLARLSPDIPIVVGTDAPEAFRQHDNVQAFKLNKTGVLHCYNDKRFVIAKALQTFTTVVQIDADTRLNEPIPSNIDPVAGIGGSYLANMVAHSEKYNRKRLGHLKKLAHKLELTPDSVTFVGEALFAVTVKGDQMQKFFYEWDRIARYLEINGVHAGEGNAIGLAAAKSGLTITAPTWISNIKKSSEHLDASRITAPKSATPKLYSPKLEKLQRSLSFHYRLNRSRLIAVRHFNFYYR
ncbi:MAG: hypothetical protein AAF703_24165 [Cyanobacteria bacterium P01_D01_bin.105]